MRRRCVRPWTPWRTTFRPLDRPRPQRPPGRPGPSFAQGPQDCRWHRPQPHLPPHRSRWSTAPAAACSWPGPPSRCLPFCRSCLRGSRPWPWSATGVWRLRPCARCRRSPGPSSNSPDTSAASGPVRRAPARPLDLGPLSPNGDGLFDLVLDLYRDPLLSHEVPPLGYARSRGSARGLAEKLEGLARLIGTVNKPRYFSFDEALCAHDRQGVAGCRRCLDACPALAIATGKDGIAIDPYLCRGCGSCTLACPTGAVRYARPRPRTSLEQIATALESQPVRQGATAPVLAIQVGEALAGIPEGTPRLQVPALGSVGLELWFAALALGASRVLIVRSGTLAADHGPPDRGTGGTDLAPAEGHRRGAGARPPGQQPRGSGLEWSGQSLARCRLRSVGQGPRQARSAAGRARPIWRATSPSAKRPSPWLRMRRWAPSPSTPGAAPFAMPASSSVPPGPCASRGRPWPFWRAPASSAACASTAAPSGP